jgi:hypothetical protein
MKSSDNQTKETNIDESDIKEIISAAVFTGDRGPSFEELWNEVDPVMKRWALLAADRIWLERDIDPTRAFLLGVAKAEAAHKRQKLPIGDQIEDLYKALDPFGKR